MALDFPTLALVAACGALGAPARHLVGGLVARAGERLPWGTLVVNLSGSAAIGALAATLLDPAAPSLLWAALATGFLGAYTTVSAFSLQMLALLRDGGRARAAAYLALSVAGTILAAAGGFALARALA